MKKLLTIICALSLVLAFSMPAVALDDIEDNNTAAALLSPGADTNLAGDDVSQDNDFLDYNSTVGDVASGNFSGNSDNDDVDVLSGNTASDDDNINLLSGNTDNSDDDFMSDNDNSINDSFTNETEIDDIASHNDNREDFYYGDQVATKGGEIDNVEMDDNKAAAAMGGFALALEIEDIELNLASTTSNSVINNGSTGILDFSPTVAGEMEDSEVEVKIGSCLEIDGSVYDNTGLTGVNFSAGNFNSNANLNNVTMTVQY